MYGITADELHDEIIEDLRQYCSHRSLSKFSMERIFENERGRPLQQTIRLVIELSNCEANEEKMHEFSIHKAEHPDAIVRVKADNPQHAIEILGLVVGKKIDTVNFKFIENNEILFRDGRFVLKYQGIWCLHNNVWKNSE